MPRVFEARELRFGGYLEDYEFGDRYVHWPAKTITESEVHHFCLLTMASSPVHVDREYAAAEMEWGKNLVVGTFVYSLLLGMSVPDISGKAIANLGVDRLRHLAPLFYGDTLYGESVVTQARPSRSRPLAGVLTVETRGWNQRDETVCTFSRSVLLPRSTPEETSNE